MVAFFGFKGENMKKLVLFLFVMIVCSSAIAETININWKVDGTNYSQSTCQTGSNLILPATAPTKYGYVFRGWEVNSLTTGTVNIVGTPSPTNPVEPEFYTVGNIVLRALGSGIADTYDLKTGKITRRVGVKVLDGTEQYSIFSGSGKTSVFLVHVANVGGPGSGNPSNDIISNEFATSTTLSTSTMDNMSVFLRGDENLDFFIRYDLYDDDLAGFTSWIANQYANGTPVTIYYPLTMPTEENLY
jgi:uncharacterized repeat protein (TIGR02543 family)